MSRTLKPVAFGASHFEKSAMMLIPQGGGKITVTDQWTYVAVARNIASEALRNLSAGKVKGKTVKVRALED